MWHPADASHEGAAAETAAHYADEEDETAMEAKAVPAPLPSQATARESWMHIEWRTRLKEHGARHARMRTQ